MKKLPFEISKYISDHYLEGQVTDIKTAKDKHGHKAYLVNISKNDMVYHLKFTESGKLITSDSEPIYDEDYYEGGFFGSEEG